MHTTFRNIFLEYFATSGVYPIYIDKSKEVLLLFAVHMAVFSRVVFFFHLERKKDLYCEHIMTIKPSINDRMLN